MIESLACGTPVLALDKGAVSEVLSGLPSLICKDVDEMVDKLAKETFPEPQRCYDYIKSNFTSSIMADNYLKVYKEVINKQSM
jgi:glycosyltransferase involved in cell wall biosynthesis